MRSYTYRLLCLPDSSEHALVFILLFFNSEYICSFTIVVKYRIMSLKSAHILYVQIYEIYICGCACLRLRIWTEVRIEMVLGMVNTFTNVYTHSLVCYNGRAFSNNLLFIGLSMKIIVFDEFSFIVSNPISFVAILYPRKKSSDFFHGRNFPKKLRT